MSSEGLASKSKDGGLARPAKGVCNPDKWVDDHADYLFRFAIVRLRDPVRAEDLVQDTFLAALKAASGFAGQSSERSWLTAILKNKIFDYYRKSNRETSFTDLEFYKDEENEKFAQEGPFAGGWNHDLGPTDWGGAGAALDSQDFWKVFHECSQKLPKNVSSVFIMREVDGVQSKEICALLKITESNLWVMLHRARMALRSCIESNWFAKNK